MHQPPTHPSPDNRRPVRVGDKVVHQSGCLGVVESISSKAVARVRVGPVVIECSVADISRPGRRPVSPPAPILHAEPERVSKPLPRVDGLTPAQVAQMNAEYLALWGSPPVPPPAIRTQEPREKTPSLPTPPMNEPRRWVGPPPAIGDWVYVDLCSFDLRGRITGIRSDGNLVVSANALAIETDHRRIHRAPPQGQNFCTFTLSEVQASKSSVHVCDVHGFTVQKLESWLHIAVPDAARRGVESMQIIHGYRGGDVLMQRIHTLVAQAPFVEFIERAYYRPEQNPGVTKLLLR